MPFAPTLRDLLQERAALRDEASALLDGAEAAARNLDRTEAARFDEITERLDRLNTEIDATEADRERRRNEPFDSPGAVAPLSFTLEDGRTVPAVERGQSFADALARTRRRGATDIGPAGLPPSGDEDVGRPGRIGDAPNLLGRTVLELAVGRSALTDSERRAMSIGGSASGGGYLLSEDVSADLVDQLRASSILDRAGAVTMPLSTHETRLVRVDTDPEGAWRAEHEDVASTDLELGTVTMRPRSLAAMVTLSDELAEDAPNAAEAVESTLGLAMAAELDGRLFRGGTEVPAQMGAGVLDTAGVGTVDTLNGSAPTDYDTWLDAIALVEDANVVPAVRIDSPRTKQDLAKLKIGTGDARQLPQPAEVAALRHIVSSAVPTNLGTGSDESVSVVGDFSRRGAFCIVGVRSAFRLEATRVGAGAFEKLQVKIRIHGRYDIAMIRPAGLAKVTQIGSA